MTRCEKFPVCLSPICEVAESGKHILNNYIINVPSLKMLTKKQVVLIIIR